MSVILSLVKEIKHVKGLFVAGLVLLLLATAGAQLAPLILQHLIDHKMCPRDWSWTKAIF